MKYLICLLIFGFGLTACDQSNRVDFKNGRQSTRDSIVSQPTLFKPVISAAPGSMGVGITSSLHRVRYSASAPLGKAQGTTADGYKVQFNVQGQMAE